MFDADGPFSFLAAAAMGLVGLASGWLFLVGQFIEGYGSPDAPGGWLTLAGGVGFATAAVACHALIVHSPRRAALAASVQALTAVSVLAWWASTDFWDGTRHADLAAWAVGAILLLDGAVLLWCFAHRRTRHSFDV